MKLVFRFENFLTAINVTEPKRKRALLLHYIGEVAYDIFDTLHETGEDSSSYPGSPWNRV